ncbi:MAG: phospholipase D family protein [Thermodesulfobacteriota bacterium]|nr:phospholipase D family protein [Thermodesulfobacteriota bacterium]
MEMEIYSVWYYDEDKTESLSQDIITREMKRAEIITIISAYYSVSFLESIFRKVNKTKRKKCIVNLVFNGFSGQRLYDQLNELKNLKSKLSELGFSNISIFLNRETTLFHTKLYFIKNDQGSLWFSGSANASTAAFERNEEILFKTRSKINNIKQYISEVIDDSTSIEDMEPDEAVESNIIGFFRTGSIYFKPNNQLSFTFSEFKLPESVEDRISNIEERPRNTNPGKAWGAYNLKLSLGLKSDEENEKTSQVSLKPWSIETCYGYWVPNKYRSIVNDNVNKKSKSVREKLVEILNLMNNRGVESLLDDYRDYLDDAGRILEENEIDCQIEKTELISKYQKFIERIILKLSDSERLNKLCMPLVSTGMPEIWEDNLAYDDFSESFYEYIASCLTGQIPRVVRSIMDNLEITTEADSEEIASSFINYFESEEAKWTDEYWRL